MGTTRIQRLWTRISELEVLLMGNPHVDVEKSRKITKEMEQLVVDMRRAELQRKLRKK